MIYAEAVEVLGFREGEYIAPHLSAFRRAEVRLAECVARTGDEVLQRRYRGELDLLSEALRVVEAEPSRQPRRWRRWGRLRFALSLVFVGLVIAGAAWVDHWARQERETRLGEKVQVLLASGAIAVEKHRWPEAEAVYRQVLSLVPDSQRGRDGFEVIAEGQEEERRQQLGFLIGTVQAAIESRSWLAADDTLVEIQKLDPESDRIGVFQEKIKEGRLRDRVVTLLEGAEQAIRDEEWVALVVYSEDLERLDSTHADLPRLRKLSADGMRLMEERKIRAKALYLQAAAMDDGSYSEEALELLREALRLDREEEYQVLYQKISAHVRTLRVPESYKTIGEALADARAQDKILVGEGIYVESLILPEGVDLEGQGPEKTIIELPADQGSVVVAGPQSKEVRLASLRVRHTGISMEAERFPAIMVNGGQVSIEDCWVENGSGHGIAVIDGGRVSLQSVRVGKSGWDGLAIYGQGSRATVSDGRFDRNLHHGIDAWEGGGVTVRRSRFSGNGLAGLLAMSPGVLSRVENCTSEGNRELGIQIANGSVAEVIGNEVTSNLLGGILVKDAETRVEIANNTVSKNGKAGIMIDRDASLMRFENNRSSGNGGVQVELKAVLRASSTSKKPVATP